MMPRAKATGRTSVVVLIVVLVALASVVATGFLIVNHLRAGVAPVAPAAATAWAMPEFPENASTREMIELAEGGIEEALEWSDEEYRQAIEHYLYTPQDEANIDAFVYQQIVLDALDEYVNPHLIEILGHPAFRDQLAQSLPVSEYGVVVYFTPLDRAVFLFDTPVPPRAIAAFAPMLEHPEPGHRAAAARAVARLQSPYAIPGIRKALADKDAEVREAALVGMSWAPNLDHITGPGSAELFAALSDMAATDECPELLPQLMLRIDAPRATELFLETDLTAMVESPRLTHILQGFVANEIPIPRDQLMPLISALRASAPVPPMCESLGQALSVLALDRNPRDEPMLRILAASHHNCHETQAARAILTVHSLDGVLVTAEEGYDKDDYAGMSEAQRRATATLDLIDCGERGSIADTFALVLRDDWRDCLAGLRQMGANEHAMVYEAAIAKFGPGGPADDQSTRTRQLRELVDAKAFDKLDLAWDQIETSLMLLLVDDILAHPQDFAAPPSPPPADEQ